MSIWVASGVAVVAGNAPVCAGRAAVGSFAARAAPATVRPRTTAPVPLMKLLRETSFSVSALCDRAALVDETSHVYAPSFAITFAACWIAVRILGYVPQRQRCPFIAVRIWSSDGFFVVASRSAAWINIPFWQ